MSRWIFGAPDGLLAIVEPLSLASEQRPEHVGNALRVPALRAHHVEREHDDARRDDDACDGQSRIRTEVKTVFHYFFLTRAACAR